MLMKFQAILERAASAQASTLVRIPFDPVETWPDRTKLRVRGSICAVSAGASAGAGPEKTEFVTSLMRTVRLGYFLLVTGKMRKAANLVAGSMVAVEIEPVMDETAAEPPPELARLLKQDRSVKRWFAKLNYSTRKYIADAVVEPKSPEARVRRAEQWMERMMLTIEGEALPPPILRAAFRRQPLAQTGWEAMTVIRRRMMLLSLFTCQSPEAQAKRVERLVDEAMQIAQRAGRAGKATQPE
jgi:uncharacterized protein YdeI (YjbR/CyaY-like superfamily)